MRYAPIIFLLSITGLGFSGCDDSKDDSPTRSSKGDVIDQQIEIPWQTVENNGLDWSVQWRPLKWPIPIAEPFDLEVDLIGPADRIDECTVIVDAEMPHHGHGMNLVPVIRAIEREEAQRWLVEGMMCHMPGRWEFSVDLLKNGRMERTQWTVELD